MEMADLNRVLLIGRLGRKPEVRSTHSGDPVATLNVATSHSYQQDGSTHEETEWHRVVVFGKTAESCGRYLETGRQVFVEGTIRSRTWKDKGGQERVDREILARRVDFLGSGRRQEAASATAEAA
jgi:single-strand DNA-binding protein